MPIKNAESTFSAVDALFAAYATNHRVDEYLIGNLTDAVWQAAPPGGKGRDIASIVAHMHNVRVMWLKSAGKTPNIPAKLDGDVLTKEAALRALEQSWKAVHHLLHEALTGDGRIRGFKPDVYRFLGYLFAHDAHHRGQISILARQLGHPLAQSVMFGMWEWGTR